MLAGAWKNLNLSRNFKYSAYWFFPNKRLKKLTMPVQMTLNEYDRQDIDGFVFGIALKGGLRLHCLHLLPHQLQLLALPESFMFATNLPIIWAATPSIMPRPTCTTRPVMSMHDSTVLQQRRC